MSNSSVWRFTVLFVIGFWLSVGYLITGHAATIDAVAPDPAVVPATANRCQQSFTTWAVNFSISNMEFLLDTGKEYGVSYNSGASFVQPLNKYCVNSVKSYGNLPLGWAQLRLTHGYYDSEPLVIHFTFQILRKDATTWKALSAPTAWRIYSSNGLEVPYQNGGFNLPVGVYTATYEAPWTMYQWVPPLLLTTL